MRVKSVSVTYSRKINLGDFNSAEASATVWVQLEPYEQIGENLDFAMRDMWQMLENNVKQKLAPLAKPRDETVVTETKKLFLGIPVVETGEEGEQ